MAKEKKESRAEEMTRKLRDEIFSGRLGFGTRLIETDIAEKYGVSRGPVREALLRLEHEGLIVSEVNKGCTIVSLSAEDAYEIFFLRGTLEKIALEKCGGKLLDSSILAMRNILEDMKLEDAGEKRMQIQIKNDEYFHEEILRSSKMMRLHQLWKYLSPLNGAMFLKVNQMYESLEEEAFRNPSASSGSPRRSVWEIHREMLEVLEKGDLEASLAMIDRHYLETGERIYRWEMRRDRE